jgi:hypothetical protein
MAVIGSPIVIFHGLSFLSDASTELLVSSSKHEQVEAEVRGFLP